MFTATFGYYVYLEVHPVPLRFFIQNQSNLDEAKCLSLEGLQPQSVFFYCVIIFHETSYLLMAKFILMLIIISTLHGATKLHFTDYSCVVFILFNTGLCKSALLTNSFGKLVFHRSVLFVFSACSISNLM